MQALIKDGWVVFKKRDHNQNFAERKIRSWSKLPQFSTRYEARWEKTGSTYIPGYAPPHTGLLTTLATLTTALPQSSFYLSPVHFFLHFCLYCWGIAECNCARRSMILSIYRCKSEEIALTTLFELERWKVAGDLSRSLWEFAYCISNKGLLVLVGRCWAVHQYHH